MIYLKVNESCKAKDALKSSLFELDLNKKVTLFFKRMRKLSSLLPK